SDVPWSLCGRAHGVENAVSLNNKRQTAMIAVAAQVPSSCFGYLNGDLLHRRNLRLGQVIYRPQASGGRALRKGAASAPASPGYMDRAAIACGETVACSRSA